ncbi:MAG: AraC family transcriptional regulator [Victivallaceae bacterium]|nr:AraC family transcriptional regulator [Victivallaceae bacterium]
MSKTIDITSLQGLKRRFQFPLQVKNVGTIRLTGDRYHGTHPHNIEFCIRLKSPEAKAIDTVGGKTYSTLFPHLFIKQPPLVHKYNFSANREAFFIIYPLEAKGALSALGVPMTECAVAFELNRKITRLIAEITSLLPDVRLPGIADEIDILSYTLLCTIFNSPRKNHMDDGSREEEERIMKISSYFQRHHSDPIDLDEIIRKNGFSRRGFYRCWKRYFPLSPARFLMKSRMEEACYLLENQELSINEIASRLHFPDTAYFIVMFKRYNYMTPLRYRKKLRQSL